jgi:hypothetical protein
MKNAHEVLEKKPVTQRREWEDNIKMDNKYGVAMWTEVM